MEKITSENLSEKLSKYGAFSVAIFGAANASGQIIYTDIADETVNAINPRVAIDINADGTGDYLFGTTSSAPNFAFMLPAASSMASYNSNGIVGVSESYNYPSNLSSGAPIDGSNTIFSQGRGDFNYNGCAYQGSQFCDGNDGYVGLHFKIGTDIHYGWVRIKVAADASNIIIKDFAYNTTPGEVITTGQTTLGIEENALNSVRIVALNYGISLFNLPEQTDFNLFSVSGQSVLRGTTSGNTYIIEAASLASGVYVLELNDVASNTVIRKKVIL